MQAAAGLAVDVVDGGDAVIAAFVETGVALAGAFAETNGSVLGEVLLADKDAVGARRPKRAKRRWRVSVKPWP